MPRQVRESGTGTGTGSATGKQGMPPPPPKTSPRSMAAGTSSLGVAKGFGTRKESGAQLDDNTKRPRGGTKHNALTGQSMGVPILQTIWQMTPDIKQQLDAQGIVYKTGKWTEKEKGVLRDNVKKYATQHNIADVSTLVLPGKGSGKGSGAAQHPGFYGAVTEGINRPIISVYQCLLRWYRPADITGKFTQAETDKLLKLKALHGHDWKKISEKLGRNPISVKDHARVALAVPKRKIGSWSTEEEQALTEMVHNAMGTAIGTNVDSGVPWKAIATKLKSRTEKQCRQKWNGELNWKQRCPPADHKWTTDDNIKLMEGVHMLGCESESEINWNRLAREYNGKIRSGRFLQAKWTHFKKQVPDQGILSLDALIIAMKDKVDYVNSDDEGGGGRG